MRGHGEKLTRKQDQAIAALIAQPTIAAAAGACGVSVASLFRWLQNPDFAEEYRQARRSTVNQAVTAIQAASTEAVEVLRKIMSDEGAPVPSRVTAAKAVLETAFKAVELEDITERIAQLELMAAPAGGQAA